MGNRILRESICTSDSVDAMDWFEEVLFYRILVNCDDYGRTDARPAILKARLFPLKTELPVEEIMACVNRLARQGVIVLYEVDNHPYLYVPTWEKYQTIRNKRSKYPAPDEGEIQLADNCNQLQSNVCPIQSNPIQSEFESESESESEPKPASPQGEKLGNLRVLCSEVVSVLNENAKTKYRPFGKRTMELIEKKLDQGYTKEDLLTVLDKKAKDWLHPRPGERDMRRYYRPETLFGEKFESYLNEPSVRESPPAAKIPPAPRWQQQTESSLDLEELQRFLDQPIAPVSTAPPGVRNIQNVKFL